MKKKQKNKRSKKLYFRRKLRCREIARVLKTTDVARGDVTAADPSGYDAYIRYVITRSGGGFWDRTLQNRVMTDPMHEILSDCGIESMVGYNTVHIRAELLNAWGSFEHSDVGDEIIMAIGDAL